MAAKQKAKQKDVWRSLDEAKELHEAGMRFTRCRFCRTSSIYSVSS
jgi:hypothetical protein